MNRTPLGCFQAPSRLALLLGLLTAAVATSTGAVAKVRKVPATTPLGKSPPQTTTRLLDDLLLKDLDTGVSLPKAPKETAPQVPAGQGGAAAAGEDVRPGRGNVLTVIGGRMREVQQRLSHRDTSVETQATQQLIVRDLQQLIEQLRKKCCSSAASASRQEKPQKPGQRPKPGQKPGQEAARDSTNQLGQARGAGVESEAMRRALSEFWGHLPERFRQQLQTVQGVEFLPQYEKLIEDYYKRLAEEPDH